MVALRPIERAWRAAASTEMIVPTSPAGPTGTAASTRALMDKYCVTCHSTRAKTANLMLDQLDLAHLSDHAEIGEKVIRKLRGGLMPPAGRPRPDRQSVAELVSWLENEIDTRVADPKPGRVPLRRLNLATGAAPDV